MAILSKVVIGLLPIIISSFHVGHRVSCTKKKMCNGNLMCAFVCEPGSVDIDEWAAASVSYQQKLQMDDPLVIVEFPGTHNSAISEAYGYGIEKYFISALGNGIDEDQGDDVGVGVCQYMSLIDQMNLGIRHVEVDVWWGPKQNDTEGDMVVCHSPVPLYPVGAVNRAAEEAGLNLEWDPKNMSCIGTKRLFRDVLQEIKDWMVLPDNLQEIVIIYIDTKIFLPNTKQITQGTRDIWDIFGDMTYAVGESGTPLYKTKNELLALNKRIIFENQKDIWLQTEDGVVPVVVSPVMWTHQYDENGLEEFPNCTVEGDTDWYGTQMIRALGDKAVTEASARCGGNIVSPDYINADDMKFFVWSWDEKEPSSITDCTAMLPNGRWGTLPCDTELPVACLSSKSTGLSKDSIEWYVDVEAVSKWNGSSMACREGFVPAVPRNGYMNALLNIASYGQTVWLNVRPSL